MAEIKDMILTELHSFERDNKDAREKVLINQEKQKYTEEVICMLKGFLRELEQEGSDDENHL